MEQTCQPRHSAWFSSLYSLSTRQGLAKTYYVLGRGWNTSKAAANYTSDCITQSYSNNKNLYHSIGFVALAGTTALVLPVAAAVAGGIWSTTSQLASIEGPRLATGLTVAWASNRIFSRKAMNQCCAHKA